MLGAKGEKEEEARAPLKAGYHIVRKRKGAAAMPLFKSELGEYLGTLQGTQLFTQAPRAACFTGLGRLAAFIDMNLLILHGPSLEPIGTIDAPVSVKMIECHSPFLRER